MGKKSISFRPRPFDPNPKPGEADPALKEGNLLSNVLNKAARSCFYTIQNFFDGRLPVGEVGAEAREACAEVTREFERHVLAGRYYQAMDRADVFIRGITKAWNRGVKAAEAAGDEAIRRQTVIDCLHMVRVAMVLMHPVAPAGTEMFRRYLNVDERFWRWEHLEEPVYFFMANPETHELVTLEPRVDFFPKHPSQFAK
jgi:methionyl-tRNA synthetase